MSEFERLLHLFVSLQILFGSRRGGMWIPVLILALLFGGIFAYNHFYNNVNSLLASADRKWNSGVERQQMEAINEYMQILDRDDANILNQLLNPGESASNSADAEPLLQDVERRQILYKRIISHKFNYVNEEDAAIWIEQALNENMNLKFVDDDVAKFWEKVKTKLLGGSEPKSNRDRSIKSDLKPGKFDTLPGVDQGARLIGRRLSWSV